MIMCTEKKLCVKFNNTASYVTIKKANNYSKQ